MIITRTPFRISFFGGGTDYPAWYRENGGAVLATSIDKYCYLSCRYLPPFFGQSHRIVYSRIELTTSVDEIAHPSVRCCLKRLNVREGIELVHNADLPARTGLGSSSSFTVGLLHALTALRGGMLSRRQLAELAIDVEQNLIGENVGSQDQISAALGGLNLIRFHGETFSVHPVPLTAGRLRALQDHLMLFFTGVSRTASEIAAHQIRNIPAKRHELTAMHQMVDDGLSILASDAPLSEFGALLHESWLLKRSLSPRVSTDLVDDIYARAMAVGATGGKLLGAGGGGFVLIFAPPDAQPRVRAALAGLQHVPFAFEREGSHLVFYSPGDAPPAMAADDAAVGRDVGVPA